MGQGTDSCGGYDFDYDGYDCGLSSGLWTQRNGTTISVSKMSLAHLYNARRIAKVAADRASFTSDARKFNEWCDIFTDEIERRNRQITITPATAVKPATIPRGTKVKMKCHCGTVYLARTADLSRGWGLSCSKACAAERRETGSPRSKPV